MEEPKAVVQSSGLRLSDPWCQDPKFVDECQPSPFPSPRAGEVWAHLMVLGGNHLHDLHLAPWSERLQHLQPVIISIISKNMEVKLQSQFFDFPKFPLRNSFLVAELMSA